MKILDLLAPYIKGRVLLLGSEPERLANPEWLTDRSKTHEARPSDRELVLNFIRDKCEYLTQNQGGTKKFDLVIDAGHLEHCKSIYSQLGMIADSVKNGGVVFHLSPLSMLNWGYYNICPKLFHEFYKDWETLEAWAWKKEHAVPLPMDRASIASEVSMIFAARK